MDFVRISGDDSLRGAGEQHHPGRDRDGRDRGDLFGLLAGIDQVAERVGRLGEDRPLDLVLDDPAGRDQLLLRELAVVVGVEDREGGVGRVGQGLE